MTYANAYIHDAIYTVTEDIMGEIFKKGFWILSEEGHEGHKLASRLHTHAA